jgi:predicted permease
VTWWQRLRNTAQVEAQLDAELRFDFDQRVAANMRAGMNQCEARRAARLAFGGLEQVKEECRDARGTRWLQDLWQDFRYALRTLRQKPGFAAVAILTLALGSGATTVMFTVINAVLLKPLPYPQPERLVSLNEATEKYGDNFRLSYPDFIDCKRDSRSLASMAAWTYGGGTVSKPGSAEYVASREMSSETFSVLGVTLVQGRAFQPEEDRIGAPSVAIVSSRLWQQRYAGSPSAIGAPLVFAGKPYTIVGVAPTGFQLDGEADVFTPIGQNTDPRMQNREAHFLPVVARLRPGATLATAQDDLALIGHHLARQYPKSNAGFGFKVHPLLEAAVGRVRPMLLLLLGAVSLILLIACINVASLLLARAVSRERELALRVSLGAGGGRLARHALTESAVLALAGGSLGILLAAFGIRPFVALWPGALPRSTEVHLDWRVLLFALAVSLLCGIFFGLAPALRAPVRKLDQTLRAGARSIPGGSRRLHSGFVISQIAIAVVLLVAAGTLARELLRLSSLDPGLNVRNVLVARVALAPRALANPAQTRAAWTDVLDRARAVPGVKSIALTDIIPMREGENALGYWTTPAPPPLNQAPISLASSATPAYLNVMGIPLRQGRFFTDQDRMGSEPVVVIDEVLARHAFGSSDALGKRLFVQAMGPTTVVGIVGHVRHWGLADDDQAHIRDQLYYPFSQVPDPLMPLFSRFMSMAVRTGVQPLSVVEPLGRALRGTAADQSIYEVRTMEQLASGSLARQRFLMLLFGIFAGLALLLACIGIYGVLAYLTSQRVPEFGVRMAVGARAGNVIRLVLRQSVGMIFAGLVAGILAAVAAGRLLERLVTGIRPAEPLTFAAMVSVLVIAALFASFLPARHASRVDPMSALRQE